MFFILSKLLAFLIMPFVIICCLFLAAAVIKKQRLKKILFYTGLSLMLFFSNDFIFNEIISLWEVPVTTFSNLNKHYRWAMCFTVGSLYDEWFVNDRGYYHRG